jgi:hypothetical protein
MARRKFTPEELKLLERYAGMGGTWKQMAHLLGISYTCFANYMRDIPEFKEAVDRGAANASMQPASWLRCKSNGHCVCHINWKRMAQET